MKRPMWFVTPIGIALIAVLGISWFIFSKQDKCLKMAAGLQGGDSYTFSDQIKNLVEKYSDNRICISVLKNPDPQGTEENLEKLNNNEAQLATAQTDILVMKGLPRLRSDKGRTLDVNFLASLKNAQVVSKLFPDMYQLIVRGDSGIKSVSDLERKRIAMPPEKGGQIKSFAFLMQHYELIAEDQQLVTLVEVGEKDQDLKKALCEKENGVYKVDAVFQVRAIGNQAIRELLRDEKCKARLVPLDQAAALKTQNFYLEEASIPKGVYRGGKNPLPDDGPDNVPDYQKQKVKTVSVQRLLLAHKDVPKEVIQLLTKILYEHQQDLIKEMPLAANISPPNNLKGIGLPIHEGAQAYYDREKPSWVEQNSGAIQVFLGIMGIAIAVIPGLWLLKQRFEQTRKNKADDYIREVTALMNASDCVQTVAEYLNANTSNDTKQLIKFRDVITEKVAKILVEKRVAELGQSKKLISDDSLKSFSKTLRKVVNAIENMPQQISKEIFNNIPQKATEVLDEQHKRHLHNQLLPFINNWQKFFGLMSLNELQNTENEKLKTNLDKTLQHAKASADMRQALLEPSQFAQFLKSESLEIQRDLDAIFKRAVNALVEERISQESFQSFRVVWQIAVGDVDKPNA